MWSERFNPLFFLRKPKNYRGGKQPVYMRITIDGARIEWSTQRKCDPERWNSRAGRGNGTKAEIRALNSFLETLQARVQEAHRSLLEKKEAITIENIRKELEGTVEQPHMILEVYQHHNDQMAALVGKEYSRVTLIRYKTSLEHTRNFIQWKYQVADMDILKLNYEFISEYAFYLKSIRNCNHNTTMKYLTNFKKVVLLCVKNDWLLKDPFINFNLAKREVERDFLTEAELQSIISKEFSTERLNYVRDIFLFSCFTGLAFIDVKQLKRSEVGV